MSVIIQLRRDTAANWTSANPILADGEIGYEKDTGKDKIGDGATAWNSLAYRSSGGGGGAWGSITGTLSDQTDLQSALDGKQIRAGFVSQTAQTLSFNNGTRVLTVTPTGANYTFYVNGVLYTKTTGTVTIPNTVGQHFCYYDNTGTLQTSTSPWDITSTLISPVATVYWDGTTGVAGMEFHSADRDRQMHRWAHDTIGARYETGLAGTFTNTTLSVSTGTIHDEDQEITITGPVTTCRLWYRNASNQLVVETSISTPYKATAGTLQYDNAGTLTNVTAARYIANFVYATNDVVNPIAVVVSQAQYTTVAAAQAAPQPTFPNLATREWKLLYLVVYQNNGGTPTYNSSVDYRTSSSLPGGGTTSLPASNVTFTASGSISSTNVQSALEELDTEKVALVNYIDWANPIAVTGATTLTIGKHHVCSGTTADYTVTLPTAASSTGQLLSIEMAAGLTKLVTVDGNGTETIDGATTRIMWAQETAVLKSDGSTWSKIAGKTRPMTAALGQTGNLLFANSVATRLTNMTVNLDLKAPASFMDAANNKLIACRPGLYDCKLNTLAYGGNATACAYTIYVYKNGANLFGAAAWNGASAFSGMSVGVVATLATGDYIQPYGYYAAGSATTSVFYDDSAAPTYNRMVVTEIPSW